MFQKKQKNVVYKKWLIYNKILSEKRTKRFLGQTVEILIEKESKKSDRQHWSGRNSENMVTVFPKENYKVGDFVMVKVSDCTTATLIGEAVGYSEVMN
jgi:tRNA-2-methylthio-N6-dimethylallyladenosine synthase